MKVVNNILDLIGETPLVRINKLNPNKNVELYAKLESFNPGGSLKDRIILPMIENAERTGELTKDMIILEPTSGNTGIGLAMAAAIKGYRIVIVMPESVSIERRKIIKAFGAELILTSGERGTDGAIEKALEITKENPRKYFMPFQWDNENNVRAHYEGTGEEIWKQTKGKITHFVAGIGTTGTLMGVSKKLKEYNPQIKIIGVEPNSEHKIQGLRNLETSRIPKIFNEKLLDERVKVSDEDAFQTTKLLAKVEGIFAGISSGAAMFVALQKSEQLKNGLIVVLLPDSGERYLSTNLWD